MVIRLYNSMGSFETDFHWSKIKHYFFLTSVHDLCSEYNIAKSDKNLKEKYIVRNFLKKKFKMVEGKKILPEKDYKNDNHAETVPFGFPAPAERMQILIITVNIYMKLW